jgi:DNA-directed RNA polymerase I subunit RPA1
LCCPQSCYELYGSNIAGQLLSILGRLFTKYVQMIGFTCRMDDLQRRYNKQLTSAHFLPNSHQPEGDKWRRDLINGGENFGRETAREYAGLGDTPDDAVADAELQRRMEEVLRSDEKMAGMDAAMKGKMNGLTSSVINKCLPGGLVSTAAIIAEATFP